MRKTDTKEFLFLDTPISCEVKTIDSPIRPAGSHTRVFHNHDGYEIYLFLEGDVNHFTEKSGKKLERGDLILSKPYQFHCAVLNNENIYNRVVINISQKVMQELCASSDDFAICFETDGPVLTLDDETAMAFVGTAEKLQRELVSDEWGSSLLCSILLQELLILIRRQFPYAEKRRDGNIMPALAAQTFSYIEEHITQEITLQILSRELHHNGTYISRCFKKVTGCTLQSYVIAKRIGLAKQYLRRGVSPTEACYLSGFQNYSNFSRMFHRQTGCSPKQYQACTDSFPEDPDKNPVNRFLPARREDVPESLPDSSRKNERH